MTWHPTYKLYQNNGSTEVYEFVVTSDNSPQDPIRFYEVTGSRGQGSIIIPGANSSWDLQLRFHLSGVNYEAIIAQMDSLESSIVLNTEYILKIQRTISTTKDYNVKRIVPFQWDNDRRVFYQKGLVIFKVNSW